MSSQITIEQVSELLAQSKTGRIVRDALQRFLENPDLVYGSIFERMLASCKFDWVNKNITPKNFPIAEEPDPDTEYELVCLEKYASTNEAEAEIKRRGLESTTLADLLLYVCKNPDEQRKYSIVALDSKWQFSGGGWCSPDARDWGGGRCLSLSGRERGWLGYYRFLARKPR